MSLLLNLEPGDHIAATRKNGMYEHHGIYEGSPKGYPSVIHFQGPKTSFVKGSASQFCECGYYHPKKGGLVISCLDCFSQGEKMLKFRYMTNKGFVSSRDDDNWNDLRAGKVISGYRTKEKKYYLEHFLDGKLYGHSRVLNEKPTDDKLDDQVRLYNMISERSSKEVLDKAFELKIKRYNLGDNNCEHFAVYCKTGVRISNQVQKFPVPSLCKWLAS